jgi:excisionase family DNA binding protein
MTQKLWSIHDAAKYPKVSERTIRNWMRSRRISFIKVGRVVRFDPDQFKRDLEAFEQKSVATH